MFLWVFSEPNNVVSILISSDFLKMDTLVRVYLLTLELKRGVSDVRLHWHVNIFMIKAQWVINGI